MEKYLNMPIKEVISRFPGVADILNEYKIGCVPCNVGSCLLKDVVAIHNLPEEQQLEMMYRIEKAIYPGRDVKKPVPAKVTADTVEKELKYSPPIKRLVDEHTLIKRWIGLVPEVTRALKSSSGIDRQMVLDGVDFIRSYADRFHHAKEEKILFGYFDESLDIIKTMLEDHETARGHVRAILEALERQDRQGIIEHLSGYRDLLAEHIKKEDEILYPWLDRNLSVSQVGELFRKFDEADSEIGVEVPERCEKFIAGLEGRVAREEQASSGRRLEKAGRRAAR